MMTFPFSLLPGVNTDFHAPFSGDVVQSIEPRVFSPDIAGDGPLEERIHMNVASYGKQLGKILEALQALSTATEVPLPEIDALVEKVEAEKTARHGTLRADAETALARLKAADPEGWAEVVKGA